MRKIAIIGEFIENYAPHSQIETSIQAVAKALNIQIEIDWLNTEQVLKEKDNLLQIYSGFWSAPGSPFKSLEGALYAIEYARIHNKPHLGTCAGFQHTIIEFARNVLNIPEAQHEEYSSNSNSLFISKLDCSLAGKQMNVQFADKTLTASFFENEYSIENYYCNFGLNPKFEHNLKHPQIIISGVDEAGEIRIIEYKNHPFFIATLFVPQTNKFYKVHPIIFGFIRACLKS